MAKVKRGFQGKIYLNSGSYGTPVWNEVSAVKGVKVGADFDEQELSLRLAGGIKQWEPILLGLSFTGMILSDETDTAGFLAMDTAFLSRSGLDAMFLDGGMTAAGSRGYRVDVKVFKFGEDQDNANVDYREFEIKPCLSTNPAQKVVVTTDTPVFTSLAV